MKKSIVLLLSILVFAGCAGQKAGDKNGLKIEYKVYSRGFYQVITIENQIVFVTKSREGKPEVMKLSTNDWNSLQSMVQELDEALIPSWKAPTEKRLFDGAAIASLKITKHGKTFESQSFDHGYPPAEIEKVVNKTLSFVN
jgi:hypothetical protein